MESRTPYENAWQAITGTWTPPPKLTPSEWADRNGRVVGPSAEPGRWRTRGYQRAILDAGARPEIERIVFRKSARLGWTQILCQIIGYYIDQDPCSILAVQPTIDDAESWSKDTIAPLLEETPALEGKVSPPRSRDSKTTISKKHFAGGILYLNGANSPRGFRRISTRIVLLDEVDGYPPTAGDEGDQVKLAERRSEDYWNRKVFIGSTPTIAGVSRVAREIEATSQGFYFLDCPHCDGPHVRKFREPEKPITLRGEAVPVSFLQWEKGNWRSAAWVCPHCGGLIDHSHHRAMVEAGRWIGEHWEHDGTSFSFLPGFDGWIGFNLWAGYSYSPNMTPSAIAREWLGAQDDPDKLQTVVNTVLGEEWEERGETVDDEKLAARVEDYPAEVPAPVVLLVAGVDVQSDRLEVEILGVGEGEETWSIDYQVVTGDPAQYPGGPWPGLTEILAAKYEHQTFGDMAVSAVAIDTGHLAAVVYKYIAANRAAHWYAVKGVDGEKRPVVEPRDSRVLRLRKRRRGRKWAPEIVGVDEAKSQLYRRLRIVGPDPKDYTPGEPWKPGYCHFPRGRDPEYFAQLTAEKVIPRNKRGRMVREWVKTRPRNEALDVRVYAMAALYLFLMAVGLDIAQIAAKRRRRMKAEGKAQQPTPAQQIARSRKKVRRTKRGAGFLDRWKR